MTTGEVTAFSDSRAFLHFAQQNTIDVIVVLLPIFAALSAAGILASAAVGGLTFSPAGLRLRWNAINPAHTIPNMFSRRSAVHLLASILKLLFVALIMWLYLNDKLEALAALRWAWSAQIVTAIAKIVLGLGLRVGLAIAVIGLADALYQKWQHLQELKMTRQEVRQERKDLEGAPEIKARIRRIQVEMSMRRLRQEVPKASVILVNPTHVAVALRYEAKTMEAPVLLAKGADLMAERIVRSALLRRAHRPAARKILRGYLPYRQARPAHPRSAVHGRGGSARHALPPPPEEESGTEITKASERTWIRVTGPI
jgi:flagellar biosynthetic protein FlhB